MKELEFTEIERRQLAKLHKRHAIYMKLTREYLERGQSLARISSALFKDYDRFWALKRKGS